MGYTRRKFTTVAIAVVATASTGLGTGAWPGSAASAARAANEVAPAPAASAAASVASVGPVGRSGGPLSPRLAALARPTTSSSRTVQARIAGLPSAGAGSLLRRPDGRILVRLRLTDLSPATRAAVTARGATFVADGHDNATATVAIATTQLRALAALRSLRWAQEELTPHVGSDARVARVAGRAAAGPTGPGTSAAAQCPSGVVSEGDARLNAFSARRDLGVTGAGVKVGVLSDSYNALGGAGTDVGNNELPGAGNHCGFTTAVQNLGDFGGGTDEGRAMAQIIHDLAPGATLAFRTAFDGEQDFANGIRALRDAGAKVIVDDVSYDDEPMFQDGFIAKAIDDVEASGVAYFSSAGNSNFVAGGREVGSYEAPAFRAMPCPAVVISNDPAALCHDFNPGTGISAIDQLTVAGDGSAAARDENEVRVSLGWSQPQFGITADFDLYLLDQSDAIVASAIVPNIRSGMASENLGWVNYTGATQNYRLVIARHAGTAAPRIKVIFGRPSAFTAVQWNVSAGGDIVGPTIYGHNAPLKGASVAATPFYNSNIIETYSSRGPALYCWQPVSSTTPSAALSPCQTKPVDFAATDGAVNSFFGGEVAPFRFYGTSAAAPHAAAIAALQQQRQPCRTPAEILAALRASGRPVGTELADAAGSGLLDATTAVSGLVQCRPSAPAMPAVLSATGSSATVHWAAPASPGSPITSYRVTVYAGQSATASQAVDTGNAALTATIPGLAAGTLYRFKVAATNGAGTGSASGYSVNAALPFASLAAFTTQQYQDFAGRDPTGPELTTADNALAAGTGGATPAGQIAADTGFSNWGPQVDPVTRLYYAFFQRPPDLGGLRYWSGQRRAGASPDAIAGVFAASVEFQHTYGSLTNRQFVDLVYQNALGRPPDAGGADFWTSQLDRHLRTRGRVMAGFSESNEHKNRRAGEVNTVDVFFGMLRRVPTDAERATWVPVTATSKIALVNGLLGTSEYAARL